MTPLTYVREALPPAFERGVALLRERTEGGDPGAQARLDDVLGASGAARIGIEGEGTVWLAVEKGLMRALPAPPAELPIRFALSVPMEAVAIALGELERRGDIGADRTALELAQLASARAQRELEAERLEFHVVVTGVPDVGDAVARVGLNVSDPPEKPRFTATLRFEDLEDLWEGSLDPTQLLTGGRIRFGGDYVPAFSLALRLAQKR